MLLRFASCFRIGDANLRCRFILVERTAALWFECLLYRQLVVFNYDLHELQASTNTVPSFSSVLFIPTKGETLVKVENVKSREPRNEHSQTREINMKASVLVLKHVSKGLMLEKENYLK